MADIMLVLLIIFMVVTPMLQKGQSVDMATTDTAIDMKPADQDDAILLAVGRDGRIYLGTEQIGLEQVIEKVADLWEATSVKTVYVKSDRRAKFGDVSKLVDEIRSLGVDKLGLLTERTGGRESAEAPEIELNLPDDDDAAGSQ
jgi:biopolymer transport protein ExbD/biopolymer transport protein TolR